MTEEEKKEALSLEQQELRRMIREGVAFDVEVTCRRREPGLRGFFRKRRAVTEKKVYRIEEPTLATLDRLSSLWLKMSIDEAKMGEAGCLAAAKEIAAKEARTLAEVVAVAVLGEDLYIARPNGAHYTRRPDTAALGRLADTLYHAVKPSELLSLAILITNMSNLGDFINSIRLMGAARTSDPGDNLVED